MRYIGIMYRYTIAHIYVAYNNVCVTDNKKPPIEVEA